MITLGSGVNSGETTIDGVGAMVGAIEGVPIVGVDSVWSFGCCTAVLMRCDNFTRAFFVLSPYCRYRRDVGGDFKMARISEADCTSK